MSENSGLITAKEAVDYLGISLSTLHKIEKQGLLVPFRTPGGHRRYDKSMLDEYLEASKHGHARGKEDAT
jgi:excisionase family DNA binding protein